MAQRAVNVSGQLSVGKVVMKVSISQRTTCVVALIALFVWMGSTVVLAADDPGIRFQRTGLIASGKGAEAVEFALKVSKYINDNYTDTKVTAYMEMFGEFGRVHWFADYQDLATLQKVTEKLQVDQGYNALVATGIELFVVGSMEDKLFNTIAMPGQ